MAGNRPWMPPGEKRPLADKKCTTLLVMLIVPSDVWARRACQRVKDRETGWLAQRDDPGLTSEAAKQWSARGDVRRGAPPLRSAHDTIPHATATVANRRAVIPIWEARGRSIRCVSLREKSS